jgi:hypothetical protein
MLQFQDPGPLCGKLQPWERIPQFFIFKIMQSINKAYKVRLEKLQQQSIESEAKNKASLQRLRSLVEELKSLDLGS